MADQHTAGTAKAARLTGIGVGPGDPALLTLGALDVLRRADRVVAPTTDPGTPGRAESVVKAALPDLAVDRLVFDMSPEGSGGEAARAASHLEAARRLLPWLGDGEQVAFVTLGDPNIYSTFPSLVAALGRLGWHGEVATVPGITAFQALAAATGTVLLDGTESLSLVTALDGTDHVAAALEDPERAIVVYKGGRHIGAVARLLAERDRLRGAVFGERLGLDDQRVGPLQEAGDGPASYLVTVVVPPASRGEEGRRR
ncbi:MAG TPA: precorrin-2 C(20)-methyltransferase [Acidimicrobiales bacterium]|nr:precorrin-2 C(20)-methyltransferase [Acidimicrobiales bacterium]